MTEKMPPRINDIIWNSFFRELDETERKELEQWIQLSDENRLIYEDAINRQLLEESLDFMNTIQVNQKLKEVKQSLQFSRRRYPAYPVLTFARQNIGSYLFRAALLVGAIIFVLFQSGNADQTIKPGSNKATLTRVDGYKQDLENTKNGLLINEAGYKVIKKEEELSYFPKSTSGSPDNYTLTIPKAGTYKLSLSDQTKVKLNAASSIEYPSVFTDEIRKVTVTGEVFFEVAKMMATLADGQEILRPFIIEIKNTDVKVQVVGTEFNLNAYSDETSIRATLVKGSIEVIRQGQIKKMKQGQQLEIRGENMEIKDVSDSVVNATKAWTVGKFDFERKEIDVMLREIARWYDLELDIQCPVPSRQFGFGGQLNRSMELNDMLQVLKMNDVYCEIKRRKIIVKYIRT